MKKSCLLICYTELSEDPRVIKHFEALKEDFDIFTAGFAPIGKEKEFTRIIEYSVWDAFTKWSQQRQWKRLIFSLLVLVGNFLRFKVFHRFYFLRYWTIHRVFVRSRLKKYKHVDLIVSNDLTTLPLAVSIAGKNSKVVYDAHEYHAEEHSERPFWVRYNRPLIEYLYEKYLKRANACMTVGENIAARYTREYKKDFAVILNTPPFMDIMPRETSSGTIKLIHPGMYGPNRKVDELIRAMELLPDKYELHLLLLNDLAEMRELIALSKARDRIFVHKTVPLNEVTKFVSQFDLGVHLMAAVNFNNDNALPNKYFQFIQARVATVFGPLSEIKSFTEKHRTGIILKGFNSSDLAEGIEKLSLSKINEMKRNNDRNARLFCEENEIVKLKEVYKHVMQ